MSTWTILVIAVFFNATDPPTPYSAVLLPGVKCDEEVAADFARHMVGDHPVLRFQYSCDDAKGPDVDPTKVPAPAKKHIPGDTEA